MVAQLRFPSFSENPSAHWRIGRPKKKTYNQINSRKQSEILRNWRIPTGHLKIWKNHRWLRQINIVNIAGKDFQGTSCHVKVFDWDSLGPTTWPLRWAWVSCCCFKLARINNKWTIISHQATSKQIIRISKKRTRIWVAYPSTHCRPWWAWTTFPKFREDQWVPGKNEHLTWAKCKRSLSKTEGHLMPRRKKSIIWRQWYKNSVKIPKFSDSQIRVKINRIDWEIQWK